MSSSLLGKMAAAAGQPYVETLTGFKWIGRRRRGSPSATRRRSATACDPEHVRDKDGVSALLLLCELAAALKAEGRSLLDLLDDLAREHGLHATDQVSVRVDDLALITGGDGAAARPRRRPSSAGSRVERSTTSRAGSPSLPPTDGLRYRLADGARVIVRPSGTEPKLKCYLEVVVPVEAGAAPRVAVEAARISAAARLDAIGGRRPRGARRI